MTTLGVLENAPNSSAWANTDLWNREYEELRAIPSSHRETPSRSFLRLERSLGIEPDARVLDAGAGTGRHTLYLAGLGCEVHAVDASGAACEALKARLARRRDLRSLVHVEKGVLGANDLPAGRYNVIIDSYASCHILDDKQRRAYLSALIRLLRPNGTLYTSYMGADDSYYRLHLSGSADSLPIAIDPLNGVQKLLQTRSTFKDRLRSIADVTDVARGSFVDSVANKPYFREVLAAVIRR